MQLLGEQIQTLRNKVEPFKKTSEYGKLTSNVDKYLEKTDLEAKKRKASKYQRDLKDFQTNQVYKWKNKMQASVEVAVTSSPERESLPLQVSNTKPVPPPSQSGPIERNWRQKNLERPSGGERRQEYQNYTQYASPRTPGWRGHRGNCRGNSRGGPRGASRKGRPPSNHYEYSNQDRDYAYQSPLPTQNYYEPLRDDYRPVQSQPSRDDYRSGPSQNVFIDRWGNQMEYRENPGPYQQINTPERRGDAKEDRGSKRRREN